MVGHRDLQLTVEGDEKTVRGFFRGFFLGRNGVSWPLFNAELGIAHDRLLDAVQERLHLRPNHAHVIVAEPDFEAVQRALADPRAEGLELVSVRPIEGCFFRFAAHVFTRERADAVTDCFVTSAPPEVHLDGWDPVVRVDEDAAGVELYSPVHDFEWKASGTVRGPLRPVLAIHGQARRDDQVVEQPLELVLGVSLL